MKFADIPQSLSSSYKCDIPWSQIERWVTKETNELGLELNPDFQRGHVWTQEQQIAYVEFMLHHSNNMSSISGTDVYFNHPGWMTTWKGDYVCIDGLQRITAVRRFMRSEIPAYGTLFKDYEDPNWINFDPRFSIHIMKMQTREEILQWYIDFNSAGTQHSQDELNRVREMISNLGDKK